MTAIMITIGPHSENLDVMESLIEAGVTSVRFPASKFSPGELAVQAKEVADIGERKGVDLDLVLDLPGSKTRLTNLGGFPINPSVPVHIKFGPVPANPSTTPPTLGLIGPPLAGAVGVGDILVAGDGEDAFVVEGVSAAGIDARPLTSGTLGRRRGLVALHNSGIGCGLTDDDQQALRNLRATCFTAVVISFTESADQVHAARALMQSGVGCGDSARLPALIAKVETGPGADHAGEIAAAADAVLLGRGDLLLAVGERQFHRRTIDVEQATAAADRPLIVGTQLLTSLSDSWLPNRSELSYVCELITRGVAGLMFAFETTIGRQPKRSVELLAALINEYGRPTSLDLRYR